MSKLAEAIEGLIDAKIAYYDASWRYGEVVEARQELRKVLEDADRSRESDPE